MKQLIQEYRKGEIFTLIFAYYQSPACLYVQMNRAVDGLSWLARELFARGLQWEVICDVQNKLAKEGCTTREAFINTPMILLTHDFLEKIGIPALWVRLALLELRADCYLC